MTEAQGKASISIDFTGPELVAIGQACTALGQTFNEFLDAAIRKAVETAK
jgi:hypothetical protein